MGTPEFAVPALRAVARACDVAAVVTQPDRPRGRGQHAAASAVAREAGSLGLTVLKPENVNAPESRAQLRALAPDLLAVVAYGMILEPESLALGRLGAINLHGSLLPEYRGASPVQRALWDGRGSTGVTTPPTRGHARSSTGRDRRSPAGTAPAPWCCAGGPSTRCPPRPPA